MNNKEVIINDKNKVCEYKENDYLKYEDDNSSNYIDLKNNIYIRENSDFIFKIDFKNKLMFYTLKEKEMTFESQVECSIKKDNEIILKYKIDEEEKKIIIQLL